MSDVLERLYKSEINCGLSSFWDGGWAAWLGDERNGVRAREDGFRTVAEALEWLSDAAANAYPESDFAKEIAE